MITRQEKQKIIEDLAEKLSRQKTVIFSDFTGLKVSQMYNLRKKLRKEGIDFQVAKKTLIDLALKKAGIKDIKTKDLKGQIALTFGYKDEVEPAKIIYNFSKEKENEALKILAGVVSGEYFEAKSIERLAKIPSREQLLANLAGAISSPLRGLINVFEGNLRNFVYVLSNIKK